MCPDMRAGLGMYRRVTSSTTHTVDGLSLSHRDSFSIKKSLMFLWHNACSVYVHSAIHAMSQCLSIANQCSIKTAEWIAPRGPGHPLSPFFFLSIHFLTFCSFLLFSFSFSYLLHLFSSFIPPFPSYQNSPTLFPEVIRSNQNWV